MCADENAFGRTTNHVFKMVFGPAFALEWAKKTWPDAPAKFLAAPLDDAVFLGLVDGDGQRRRGFLLTAAGALELAEMLQRHANKSREHGENYE